MRPLTFGVLVSAGPTPGGSADHARSHCGALDHALEGLADLRSGSDVAGALRALGYRARPVVADDDLDLGLRQSEIDACLLTLHGRRGGAGDVQALLAMRGVPFAGPDGPAVVLAFDKVRSRQVLAYHNLPVPAAIALGSETKTTDRALELLGWPCLVKPRRGALGLGVATLTDAEQVGTAVARALTLDTEVVLERAVEGTEVQVVLLGTRVIGSAEILERPDLDGAGAQMICPPKLPRGRLDGIHALARRAVTALGLENGLSRVDVMVGDRYNEIILEVEPLPPLCRDGVVARVCAAHGVAYEELISMLVDRIMLRTPLHATSGSVVLQ